MWAQPTCTHAPWHPWSCGNVVFTLVCSSTFSSRISDVSTGPSRRPLGQWPLLIVAALLGTNYSSFLCLSHLLFFHSSLSFLSWLILWEDEQSGDGSEVHYAHLGGCLQWFKRIMDAWPARYDVRSSLNSVASCSDILFFAGFALAPFLFIIVLDYALWQAIAGREESLGFTIK